MSLNRNSKSIAYGCEQLGGKDWGTFNKKDVERAVNCAFDIGIHTFDTADIYGLGNSEINLAKALGSKRKDARIVTKCGIRWTRPTKCTERALTFRDCSRVHIINAAEQSLKRLQIDAIPVYMIHWPDSQVPLCETLEALEYLKKEGKVLQFGLSNHNYESVKLACETSSISCVQGSLNLIEHSKFAKMFEIAKHNGLERFSYGPLAQGLLTGKYSRNHIFSKDDRRYRLEEFRQDRWDYNDLILKELSVMADNYGKSIAQIALRWVIDSGKTDIVIVGGKSVAQVISNASILNWQMEQEHVEQLNNLQYLSV